MTGSSQIIPLRIWLMIALVFAMVTHAVAQSNQSRNPVSASVEPAQVTVGDSILYQVTVQVTGAGQPSVAVPVVDPDSGLSIPTPSGTQSSVETYVTPNGFRSVQSIIYSYTIKTSKQGKFKIPPATVTLNGRTYDTDPVEVEVRALPEAKNIPTELQGLVIAPQVQASAELQRRLTGVVFILPVITSTEPYNGQQVRISYHLVIDPKALAEAGLLPRTNLDNIRIPEMTDFIVEELYPFPQDLKFQEREIGGQLYLVAPVYEAAIASTKSGDLSIEPFQISMLFTQKEQGGRSRSQFGNDPFFSSLAPFPMMGGNAVQVIAQSPTLNLKVKPVPTADRPADFAGAVGEFSVSAEVDRKQARAYDDTVKLKVTVEGEGNTESLSPPTLPQLDSFTVLGEPEVQSSGRKEGDRYISQKVFSYTLRPTESGNQEIPPVSLSSFNPQSEQFVRVQSDEIPMTIAAGSRPAPPPAPTPAGATDEAEPAPEADLRYISTQSLSAPGSRLGVFTGAAAYAMFLLPMAILAGGFLINWTQKHGGASKADSRKLATASSSQHLKEAHRALADGDTQKMYADLSEGLRFFFAAKFGVPVAEITIIEIEERLHKASVSPDLVSRLTRVLEDCDAARYAPVKPSISDAKQSLQESEKLIHEVPSDI